MNNLTIGTAGHIDHGKTSLIKAITGKDTDSLKDEKKRGITINIGFAHLDYEDFTVGFVDVPGHEKFIKNMVAGVSGIDAVMLIISADEGIMPQSIEHFNILELMGVKKGFIVISKIDLVENELISVVEEEIKELTKGTFLENSKIIKASSLTSQGIDEIKNHIKEISSEETRRIDIENPRMAIDRVFSLKGIGTVVTGTLSNGILKKEDNIYIYPKKLKSTIRNLQVFGRDVDRVLGGQRSAINLRDIDKKNIQRGDDLALPDTLDSTNTLDCEVKILKNTKREILNNSRVHLHIGTKEVISRINYKANNLVKNEKNYIRLTTEEKITAKRGDRYIIRFYSPLETIGGGVVLDPFPNKKMSNNFDSIQFKEGENLKSYIHYILKEKNSFMTIENFITRTVYNQDYLIKIFKVMESEGIISNYKYGDNLYIIDNEVKKSYEKRLIKYLKTNEDNNSISIGISKEEIRSNLFDYINKNIYNIFIKEMIDKNIIKDENNLITTHEFKPILNERQNQLKDKFINEFDEENKSLVNIQKFKDNEEVKNIIDYMIAKGELIEITRDEVILKKKLEEIKDRLIRYIKDNKKITVVEFRDMLGGNRKHSIMILEYFDSCNLTKRINDYRILF